MERIIGILITASYVAAAIYGESIGKAYDSIYFLATVMGVLHAVSAIGLVASRQVSDSVKEANKDKTAFYKASRGLQCLISVASVAYLGWSWQAVAFLMSFVMHTHAVEGGKENGCT